MGPGADQGVAPGKAMSERSKFANAFNRYAASRGHWAGRGWVLLSGAGVLYI